MSDTREQLEAGEANLALDLLTASMNANFQTMDALYEQEKERRQALEVHIGLVLAKFEKAFGGTVREYEACVSLLRWIPTGESVAKLAADHWENHDQ